MKLIFKYYWPKQLDRTKIHRLSWPALRKICMPYFVWQKILSAHCQLGQMIFIHYIRVERSKSTTRMQKAAWFVLLIHLGRRYCKKQRLYCWTSQVLADGVFYAHKDLKADIILDMATLTGGQVFGKKYFCKTLDKVREYDVFVECCNR